MNIALHYGRSRDAANRLQEELNGERADSVRLLQADLRQFKQLPRLVDKTVTSMGGLDLLVNNAALFYPTPIGHITEEQWDELFGINLKAPLFLSQYAAPYLKARSGSIINITDIHGIKPLKQHPIYSISKAGAVMLTQSLAKELGPEVRVNAIAPGAILWPEREPDDLAKQRILSRTALKRKGEPQDIARAVLFLVRDADYTTGQTLHVDGGRMLDA